MAAPGKPSLVEKKGRDAGVAGSMNRPELAWGIINTDPKVALNGTFPRDQPPWKGRGLWPTQKRRRLTL